MNITDFAVLLIIIIWGIRGMTRGLVLSIFDMISFFVAGFCALTYYPVVSHSIMQTQMYGQFQKVVTQVIFQFNSSTVPAVNTNTSSNAVIDSLMLPDIIKKVLLNPDSSKMNLGPLKLSQFLHMDQLTQYIGDGVAAIILNIFSMIVLFIIAKFILQFLGKLLDKVMKLPLLHATNKMAGGCLGVLKGVIVVYILCAIFSLFSPVHMFVPFIKLINNSMIAKVFYNNNILLMLMFSHKII